MTATRASPPLLARYSEPEALTAALPGIMFRATPLSAAPFAVSLATCRLGELVIQAGRSSPMLALAAAGPDTAVIQIPLANRDSLLLNGRHPPPFGIGLYGAGGGLLRTNPRPSTHAILALPPEAAERLLCPPSGSPLGRPAADGLMAIDAAAWQRAALIVGAVLRQIETTPGDLDSAGARAGLRAALLDAARAMLAHARETETRRRLRNVQAWRRIVQGADALLHAQPARPLYTEDLCAALRVSPTALAAAFHNILQVSPHRFLKLRRLAMVRAALLRRDGPAPLVKSVALDHGFWHLGQFAHDYRRMYGESPSATLAGVQGLPWRERAA